MELPPKSLILPEITSTDYLKGDITYDARCLNWQPYLTTKEPQKFKFDSNGCTQASGINSIETQLNFLRNDFSVEALRWFTDNGYFDENGNFDISWRYTGIKAGCSINGSSHISFWDAVRKWGLLPRKMLNYTMEQSQKFYSQEEMCADFWNPAVITKEMETLAKGALQWINVEYEYTWYNLEKWCPSDLMKAELKHAPLHIGAAVCWTWNSGDVKSCGQTHPAHSTLAFKENDDQSTMIRDQYNPYDKKLSSDYPITIVMKGVVTVKDPMLSPTLSVSVWQQFVAILRKIGTLTAKGLRAVID